MRNRPTQTIPLFLSLLVAFLVAAFQYQYLHLDASSVVSQLSMSLLSLKPPPLRADLPWRDKLEWVALSATERIVPLLGLGGPEYLALAYLRQLRQRYETQAAA
mgnify:CR=1 FL=1